MSAGVRIGLAGVLAGLAMMVWTSLAHVVLPLAQVGVQTLPGEAARSAVGVAIGAKPGLYFFPTMDTKAKDMDAAQRAYEAAAKAGPSGFVLYRPAGQAVSMPTSIVVETLKLIVVATISAALLSLAAARLSFPARAGFVLAIGVAATLTTNASYWAWYGFPGDYTAAQMLIDLVSFAVGGLVIAALIRGRRTCA